MDLDLDPGLDLGVALDLDDPMEIQVPSGNTDAAWKLRHRMETQVPHGKCRMERFTQKKTNQKLNKLKEQY